MSNQGWECPRCRQCYAPTVKKCKECKPVVAQPHYYWPYIPYSPIVPYIAPTIPPIIWTTTVGDTGNSVTISSQSSVEEVSSSVASMIIGSIGV